METPVAYSTNSTQTLNEWPQILTILSGQMTKPTFDTYLNGTSASVDGDTLTIHVKSIYAKEWIEERLHGTIAKTVTNITGQTYTIAAQVGSNGNSNGNAPSALRPEPGQFSAEIVHTDPRQQTIATSIYAIRFWQPILTPPVFLAWLTLRAFAWDEKDEAFPSIKLLSNICAKGNRHRLLGRVEREGHSATIGHLHALEKMNFVTIRTEGEYREKSYFFRVLEQLPILTPIQASWLPSNLQDAHKKWLWRHQIDRKEWEQLTLVA